MTLCAIQAGASHSTCRMASVKPPPKYRVDPKRVTCMKEVEVRAWSCLQPIDVGLHLDLPLLCVATGGGKQGSVWWGRCIEEYIQENTRRRY